MLTIYTATSSDYPIIQKIAHETWPNTFGLILSEEKINYMLDMMYSTNALSEQTTNKGHQFLIVKDDIKHLGLLLARITWNKTRELIWRVYVP